MQPKEIKCVNTFVVVVVVVVWFGDPCESPGALLLKAIMVLLILNTGYTTRARLLSE